ncbi:hypothetical protein OSTOST_04436 [Ostertagia ostertagi]
MPEKQRCQRHRLQKCYLLRERKVCTVTSEKWPRAQEECIIASQSRVDIPDLFIEDDQAVYMENTCLNDSGT